MPNWQQKREGSNIAHSKSKYVTRLDNVADSLDNSFGLYMRPSRHGHQNTSGTQTIAGIHSMENSLLIDAVVFAKKM